MDTELKLVYRTYARGPDELSVVGPDGSYTFEVPDNPYWGSPAEKVGQLLEDVLLLRKKVQELEDRLPSPGEY